MGVETVVRPVVFPNIRPAPAQPSKAVSNPSEGLAVIHGASGQHIDLPFSFSVSSSTSKPKETKRRVDEVRVYQQDNRDNYVDIDVANRIWMDDGKGVVPYGYARAPEADNIEIRNRDIIKQRSG